VLIDRGSVQPTVASAEESGADRVTVLAIDVSDSMKADLSRGVRRIDAAKEAAQSFVAALPPDVRVALVTFAGDVQVVAEPTTDHAAVAGAVQGLELAPNTALYAGVQRAVAVAGQEGTRSVLVLSDGKNDGGPGTLAETLAAIGESDVTVDVIELGEQQGSAELQAMAEVGGGAAVSADRAADLGDQFDAAAEAISSQLGINVVVPERFYGRTVTIEAQATVNGVPASDEASYPIDAVPLAAERSQPVPVVVEPAVGRWAAIVAIVGVALGVGGLLTAAALTLSKEHTRRARLARLVRGGRAADPTEAPPEREHGLREDAVALAERLLRRRDLDQSLGARLVAAGVPLRPAEWVLLQLGLALGLALLLLLATGNPAAAAVGLLLGVVLPWGFVLSRARSRHDAFASALPDMLQAMAASLSAGLTLQQAAESVARDGRPPVSEEVRRALVEVRLGMPLEDALDRVAVRMGSPDFAWVVMATRIQREVGGNLPVLLDVVAGTLRDRDRVRRQARVLSAEGRISAWVVGVLPIAFACYMLVVRPGYLAPLVSDPFGWAMLLGGSTLFVLGAIWLARLSRLKV
jgi:tight adherence protein B